jgi:uncharacterized protein (DUF488 family)
VDRFAAILQNRRRLVTRADDSKVGESTPGSLLIGTVGHSTRPVEELIAILAGFGASVLVDVRTIARSRHNPQFNRETLPEALAMHDIRYVHEPGLGGLRKPRADSINGAWRNASFRGYADYMQTPEFEARLGWLIELARMERAVIMCAESVPWRCHRSLIADALSARGVNVRHLMGPGKNKPHALTSFARVAEGRVSYPGVLDVT